MNIKRKWKGKGSQKKKRKTEELKPVRGQIQGKDGVKCAIWKIRQLL